MSIKSFVNTVFEAGVYADLAEAEKKRIRLLNRLIFVTAIVMVIFSVLDIISGYYEVLFTTALTFLIAFAQQWLVKRRYYIIAKHMVFWLMMGTLMVMCVLVGNQAGANYGMLPLCMYPLLIYRSRITALIYFFVIFGAFALVLFLQKEIKPIIVLPQQVVTLYTLVAAFNLMLITYLFTSYARSINESFEKLILEKSDQLAEAYKDITDSIAYAKRIQDAYLPNENVLGHYFPDSFLLFKPKDIISGDFYWFYHPSSHSSESGDEVFIAVADCTGHGVPGAIMSVICCNALNEVVFTRGIRDTGKILDETRNAVIRMLKSDDVSSQKDGMDVTLVRINKKTRELQFSGANNPLWIIHNGILTEVKPDKQPIGMYAEMKNFTAHTFTLSPHSSLFLFTDGYADQFGGPKGKKFKYVNMQKLLLDSDMQNPHQVKQNLLATFNEWKGELEQIDDVCIIGIRL